MYTCTLNVYPTFVMRNYNLLLKCIYTLKLIRYIYNTCTYTYICTYTCTYICTYTCTYICTYTCTYTCVCTCACIVTVIEIT